MFRRRFRNATCALPLRSPHWRWVIPRRPRQLRHGASLRTFRRTSTSRVCRSAPWAGLGTGQFSPRRRVPPPSQALPHQSEYRARVAIRAPSGIQRGRRAQSTVHNRREGRSRLRFSIAPTDTGDAVDARLRAVVPIRAGPHTVSVAFLQIRSSLSPPACSRSCAALSIISIGPGILICRSLRWPDHSTRQASSDTPSQKRIFVCRPAKASEETRLRAADRGHAYATGVPPAALDRRFNRAMEFYISGRAAELLIAAFRPRSNAFWPARSFYFVSSMNRRK